MATVELERRPFSVVARDAGQFVEGCTDPRVDLIGLAAQA